MVVGLSGFGPPLGRCFGKPGPPGGRTAASPPAPTPRTWHGTKPGQRLPKREGTKGVGLSLPLLAKMGMVVKNGVTPKWVVLN